MPGRYFHPRISTFLPHYFQVSELVAGCFDNLYDKIIVVGIPILPISKSVILPSLIPFSDCRFDYEYLGGHIVGARNFPEGEGLDVRPS